MGRGTIVSTAPSTVGAGRNARAGMRPWTASSNHGAHDGGEAAATGEPPGGLPLQHEHAAVEAVRVGEETTHELGAEGVRRVGDDLEALARSRRGGPRRAARRRRPSSARGCAGGRPSAGRARPRAPGGARRRPVSARRRPRRGRRPAARRRVERPDTSATTGWSWRKFCDSARRRRRSGYCGAWRILEVGPREGERGQGQGD